MHKQNGYMYVKLAAGTVEETVQNLAIDVSMMLRIKYVFEILRVLGYYACSSWKGFINTLN